MEDYTLKTAQYTKSLTVALPPETYDRIKAITDEEKISMADWVRAAVDAELAKNAKSEIINH